MALATVLQVRRLTGLDDADAYLLFRLPDEAALEALIEDELDVAAAYLTSKAGSNYTQTTDTNLQKLMARAEAYWVAMQLFEPLKARRVVATHFPYLQEGSDRFQELIDTEWGAKFEMLTGSFIADDTSSPYSLGAFLVSEPLDRTSTDIDCVTDQYQTLLDEVNCSWSPR